MLCLDLSPPSKLSSVATRRTWERLSVAFLSDLCGILPASSLNKLKFALMRCGGACFSRYLKHLHFLFAVSLWIHVQFFVIYDHCDQWGLNWVFDHLNYSLFITMWFLVFTYNLTVFQNSSKLTWFVRMSCLILAVCIFLLPRKSIQECVWISLNYFS